MNLKILYLTYDGLTDPLGQSQVLPYLAGLSKMGYQITIISAEKSENLKKRGEFIKSFIEKNNLKWSPLSYYKKPPVLSTYLDIRKMDREARKLHEANKFDIVHCRSYITALIGEGLKKRYNIKFIFDMRGFWADERVEGGIWKLKNPIYKSIYKYFKVKEKDFLTKADQTISLTYNAKLEIKSWAGFEEVPIEVIPCCVDTELFDTEKYKIIHLEKWWKAFNIQPHELIISYLGSLGTWYLMEEVVKFCKILKSIHKDVKFLFITQDDPKIILDKAIAQDIGRESFIFYKAERVEVPYLLKLSQASLFFVKPSYSKKASSPTRMGEILSMNIPVVCNGEVGDIEYLFENYPCGILMKDFTENSFEEAASQLLLLIDKMTKNPLPLRETALSYFDLQKGIDLYDGVYKKLSPF